MEMAHKGDNFYAEMVLSVEDNLMQKWFFEITMKHASLDAWSN